jgi:hypothetical protein
MFFKTVSSSKKIVKLKQTERQKNSTLPLPPLHPLTSVLSKAAFPLTKFVAKMLDTATEDTLTSCLGYLGHHLTHWIGPIYVMLTNVFKDMFAKTLC